MFRKQSQSHPGSYAGNLRFADLKTQEPIVDIDRIKRLICFVHVPKAGGTTLKNLLLFNYRKSYTDWHPRLNDVSASPEILQRIFALSAHKPIGYHNDLVETAKQMQITLPQFADPVCVSILRDPIDRFISTYNFVISFPPHAMHEQCKGMEFEEFYEFFKEKRPAETSNLQCHFLSGRRGTKAEDVIENIDKRFGKVVTLGNETVLRNYLMDEFGLEDPPGLGQLNKSVTKIRRSDLSAKMLQTLATNLEDDQRLFDHVREREEKAG